MIHENSERLIKRCRQIQKDSTIHKDLKIFRLVQRHSERLLKRCRMSQKDLHIFGKIKKHAERLTQIQKGF